MLLKILYKTTGTVAVIIILGLLITLPFYWIDMSKINKALYSGHKVIDSPYGTIEYIDIGEGIPVVVSHGTMGGSDFGLLQAQSYLKDNYRLIIPSRFGYLKSTMPSDSSFENQADSFAYLLNGLSIDKAIVYGMSAGGVPAIQFAIRHPESCAGLLLMSSIAYAPPEEVEPQTLPVPDFVYSAILNTDYIFWLLNKTAPSLVHGMVGASKEIKSYATEDELELLDKMSWSFLPVSERYKGWTQDGKNIDSLKEMALEKIKTPTLIISAKDDYLAPYSWSSYTSKNISSSQLITLDTGGHMLLGHMDQMRDLTYEFIENSYRISKKEPQSNK